MRVVLDMESGTMERSFVEPVGLPGVPYDEPSSPPPRVTPRLALRESEAQPYPGLMARFDVDGD